MIPILRILVYTVVSLHLYRSLHCQRTTPICPCLSNTENPRQAAHYPSTNHRKTHPISRKKQFNYKALLNTTIPVP
ncbi:hypothetical protein F5144DRAFT_37205 [Chaetomium tenue]|uniref:Uncharacterized protein n=1 Tax=Chaetomium tenue TaxID=1854479 RepID=A0ACB7PQE5_9PEZI|nr:hypothetical protein F5144DRAFT_37205 [Chaetomium globosum]